MTLSLMPFVNTNFIDTVEEHSENAVEQSRLAKRTNKEIAAEAIAKHRAKKSNSLPEPEETSTSSVALQNEEKPRSYLPHLQRLYDLWDRVAPHRARPDVRAMVVAGAIPTQGFEPQRVKGRLRF